MEMNPQKKHSDMLLNSSSFPNEFSLQSNISLVNVSVSYLHCFLVKPSSVIFSAFYSTFILHSLPISVMFLYHVLLQWQQNWSNPQKAAIRNSDFFTFQLVFVEAFGAIGCIVCSCGIYNEDFNEVFWGGFMWSISWFGETFFHILTSLERYMAVVWPISFRSRRIKLGIRNKVVVLFWLLCIAGSFLAIEKTFIVNLFSLVFGLTVVSFCSISALCVLIHPGPGEKPGKVDKKKQKAFYTIVVTLGALVLRFTASVAWFIVWFIVPNLDVNTRCLIVASVVWLTLPSTLVLPLLFLYKSGRLLSWKNIKRTQNLQD